MLLDQRLIPTVGLSSDLGGNVEGSRKAAFYLKSALSHLEWGKIIAAPPVPPLDKLKAIAQLNRELANLICSVAQEHPFFLSVGGDHSSAIGTWSGAKRAIPGDLGLIWFDAHMDAHTPETSESGNIHGMPLATLLGYGSPELTQLGIPFKPEHVVLIGVRSFERGEAALLDRLKVRVFYMEEIKKRGMRAVMEEALHIATQKTAGYGISFDLDSIDPSQISCVGTPVPNGLDSGEFLSHFSIFKKHPPIGLELVEYFPEKDLQSKGLTFLKELIDQARGWVLS